MMMMIEVHSLAIFNAFLYQLKFKARHGEVMDIVENQNSN